MSNKNSTIKKDSLYLYLTLAFIAGFLAGAAFAVYKFSSTDTTAAPQQAASNMSDQQSAAIANLEAEVTVNPKKYQAWTQLGNLYFDTDQFAKAIGAYNKSLELHSGTADIWTDLGVMYRRNKQPDKAIESFDKAIAMNPRHEVSRLNKGIVLLYDLNDVNGAVSTWEDLLTINPNASTVNGESIKEFIAKLKQNMVKQGQ